MFESKMYGPVTADTLGTMTNAGLVVLYNEMVDRTGGKPTKRFSTRAAGIKRCLQKLDEIKSKSRATRKPAQKADPKGRRGALLNLPERAEIGTHRPNTRRGKIIALATRPEGATWDELISVCLDWDRQNVRDCLVSLHKYLGHGVREEDGTIFITGEVSTRKLFNFAPREEQRVPRDGTKRRDALKLLLTREGGTLEEVMEMCGWNEVQASEAVRILNSVCGYGIREDKAGNIKAYT